MIFGAIQSSTLYIDPAATSVLITSVSAIVLALGATGIVLWRKAKKKVAQTLKIDENANKEVEAKIEFNDKD